MLLLCFGVVSGTVAQTILKGTVVSKTDGEPIPGATVLIKEQSKNGAATDFDGKFTLSVNKDQGTLVVSFIGFQTLELPFSGSQEFSIALNEESSVLDEVVLIG